MTTVPPPYRDRVLAEPDALPEEYLPFVLQIVRTFRESITLKLAADSFRQGWREAQEGITYPLTTLWNDIDAE